MIVMSQSTVCSLRLKKRKGDSNPKGTAVRAPALQDAILHQVCGYIAPPPTRALITALPMEVTAVVTAVSSDSVLWSL